MAGPGARDCSVLNPPLGHQVLTLCPKALNTFTGKAFSEHAVYHGPLPARGRLLYADLVLPQVGDGPLVVVSGSLVTAGNGEERRPYSELPREGPPRARHSDGPRSPGRGPPAARNGLRGRLPQDGLPESGNDDGHDSTAASMPRRPEVYTGRLPPARSPPGAWECNPRPLHASPLPSVLVIMAPGLGAAVPSAGSAGPR